MVRAFNSNSCLFLLVLNAMWKQVQPNRIEEPIYEPRPRFATRRQKLVPFLQTPQRILDFNWNGPLLLFSIWLTLHSCHISFCTSLEMQGSWTSHMLPHTSRKNGIVRIRDYNWDISMVEKKMLVLWPNALSMPLFHFAIKGEKFHDLEFLSLNEFLKWYRS